MALPRIPSETATPGPEDGGDVVRLRDGTVDLAAERVIRGGREVRLTTLEARLLRYLADNAGRDVPRAELQDRVWGYGPKVQTRAMDHTVTRLRSKVEAEPRKPRHLLTVHGVGYRFVPVDAGDGSGSTHPPPGPAEGPAPAAVDRLWGELADDDRTALSRAAVFRGAFGEEAADRVIGPGAAEALGRLRDRGLVQGLAARGGTRYRLADEVRALAEAALFGEERARAEATHADLVLGAHRTDDPDLARLADDHDDLIAVVERFSKARPESAARAALALDPLYYARGPGHRHIELLSHAKAIAAGGPLACEVLVARAEAWGALGDIEAAEEDAARAMEASRGQPERQARALVARGNLRRRQARFDEAYALYEEAFALSGDTAAGARALRQLASCDIEARRFEAGIARFRDLERRYRAAGDSRGVAAVLGVMGNIHNELGELSRAERCFLTAIELNERLGDLRREGIARSNLAVVLHERGQIEEARAAWEASLAIHREVVNRRFEGFAIGGLGLLHQEAGRVDEARLLCAEAAAIFREVGDRRFEAIGRARLATLAPSGDRIRAELSALAGLAEDDASAIRVLGGFADLADAREARERGDAAAEARAVERARAACAPDERGPTMSFHRLSVRLLTAWLARFTSGA